MSIANEFEHALASASAAAPGLSSEALRRDLASRLAPLVRCALRRQCGLPNVVDWVQRRAAALERAGDAGDHAGRLARQLCDELLTARLPRVGGVAVDTTVGL